MAEQTAVNRKVVGSSPTGAVSSLRVFGRTVMHLTFNQVNVGSTPTVPILSFLAIAIP